MTEFDELLRRSEALPYRLPPGVSHRLATEGRTDADRAELAELAAGARPLCHLRLRALAEGFLQLKRAHGSSVERDLYRAIPTVEAFFDRLLRCRPLAFLTASDSYLLKSGEAGAGGFEAIGTERERAPLRLARLLSYDEMQLSALLGVSTPTRFINRGDRANRGRRGRPGSFVERGVYVGQVGARFERPGRMDWVHMIREEGTEGGSDPLRALWQEFYGVGGDDELLALPTRGRFFDTHVYRQRMRLVAEPYLREAAERAREDGRKAYVHVVGLGLGVWALPAVKAAMTQLQLAAYVDVLEQSPELWDHLHTVDFSWFSDAPRPPEWRVGPVRCRLSRRSPADPLDAPDLLLVAQYAWDGNSYPGNEFWQGSLAASGDPAAMCCSLLAELQNPDVNPAVRGDRIRFHGESS